MVDNNNDDNEVSVLFTHSMITRAVLLYLQKYRPKLVKGKSTSDIDVWIDEDSLTLTAFIPTEED